MLSMNIRTHETILSLVHIVQQQVYFRMRKINLRLVEVAERLNHLETMHFETRKTISYLSISSNVRDHLPSMYIRPSKIILLLP